MKDKWLKDLQNRMSEFEMDIPDNLWSEIEKAEVRRTGKRHRSTFIFVNRFSAVAAAVAVVLLTVNYIFFNLMDEENIDIPSTAGQIERHDDVYTHNIHTPESPDLPGHTKPAISALVSRHKDILMQSTSTDTLALPDTEPITDNTKQPESVSEDFPADFHSSYVLPSGRRHENMITANSINVNSRFSVGIYSSGIFNSADISNKSSVDIMMAANPDGATWEDSPLLGMLLFNKGMNIPTDIKHRQPIRVGLSFTYKLNERLGLGSGVSYTNLGADIRSGIESNYFVGDQTLHYIGVPLNVSYNIFNWKRIQVYASAGVLAEKCVSGKLTKNFVVDGNKRETETEGFKDKPFQFSVNASAGVQLNITDKVGLYAEPGIGYYFNDGTDIKTIYKDEPLTLNLNFGLRFTLGKPKRMSHR